MTTIATNALTTLADVKETLGIASSDQSYDNLITRKINQASQQIENYCGRVFKAADYVEQSNGSNIDELVLNQRPVNSITSLEYRGSLLNTDNWITINSTYYFTDTSAGIIKLLFDATGRWYRWRISYNAGYTTIPSDLAEACATLAAYYVSNDGSLVQVKARTEGQRKIDYWQGLTGFADLLQKLGINELIDDYSNFPIRSE